MPLIVVTGFPASGKTRRSNELAEYLRSKGGTVTIHNNESLGIDRNEAYADSQAEKISRAALKTAVERGLTKSETLIVDDLNYIKGYRYELFCLARALGTTMCTIHCDAAQEQIEKFNELSGAYDVRHIRELPSRYERPNDRNRWERPLFVVRPEDEALPLQDIEAAIHGQQLNPNLATVSQPVADQNMLHEVDVITTNILAAIQKSQADGAAGGDVLVPHRAQAVHIPRVVPIGEQRRIKRQFIKLISDDGQTPCNSAAATELFLNFLLKQLAAE